MNDIEVTCDCKAISGCASVAELRGIRSPAGTGAYRSAVVQMRFDRVVRGRGAVIKATRP